jgi:hypothetical protein
LVVILLVLVEAMATLVQAMAAAAET